MFRTYTYGSQVTDIFCPLCLELRHTGFKLCLELRHVCSLENEGKGASNNYRRLLPKWTKRMRELQSLTFQSFQKHRIGFLT